MKLTNQKRTIIFAVIVVTVVLSSMLSTAMTTALPAVMADFNITSGTGQWLTSVYSLVMGILVLCSAYLVRRFPTKSLYLSGLGIFSLGIVLNAVAPNFAFMMVGRVLQAAGNGILMSLGQVILLTIYPKDQRGGVMGTYGLASGAAPIIAPTLAGIIVDLWGWRMIFYSLTVICAIALIVSFYAMENVLENVTAELDMTSVALAVVGFGGVLYGMGNIGKYPLVSLQVGLAIILGLIGCVWFSVRQLKLETPFLNLRVMANKKLAVAVIGSALFYFNMMALAVMQPLYIQSACGYSATMSGLFMMPGSIVMALLSPVMGKIYDKVGIKKLFIGGGALLAIGTFFAGWSNGNMAVFVIFNVLRCVSISMLMMPLLTWGVSDLADSDIASGQSLVTSLRTIAGAFGAAVFMAMESSLAETMSIMAAMRITFACIAAVGVVVFVLAIFATRKEK